jgi:hypothetical protein
MNHMHTRTYKTHHILDLGEAVTFPLIIFSMLDHGTCTQMSFCPKTPKLVVPKFSKLRLLQLWRPITFCADLWLRWSLKQSCIPHQKLSNSMWHATFTQVNRGDSRLLMVKNQIDTLIFGASFGHNLCFKYSNGSWKLIYVPRAF